MMVTFSLVLSGKVLYAAMSWYSCVVTMSQAVPSCLFLCGVGQYVA